MLPEHLLKALIMKMGGDQLSAPLEPNRPSPYPGQLDETSLDIDRQIEAGRVPIDRAKLSEAAQLLRRVYQLMQEAGVK